jgi:hypothetical protein
VRLARAQEAVPPSPSARSGSPCSIEPAVDRQRVRLGLPQEGDEGQKELLPAIAAFAVPGLLAELDG